MPDSPLLIFDGRCGFCKIWIEYSKKLTGDTVQYAASQDVGADYPQIPPEEFRRSVQLVRPDGQVRQGAHAVFTTLEGSPEYGWLLWLYEHVRIFAIVAELLYRLVAAHRNIAYWITRILFGAAVEPARFQIVEWLFVRLLGAVYLTAFISFAVQVSGLIGSQGILPLGNYLQAVHQNLGVQGYWQFPTVFWFGSSDLILQAACWIGAAISIVLILGFAQRACFIALFILYLSLCSGGQDFMSFQWDMLLLEAGFLAIFLGSSKLVVWLYRLLLFRLMFLSGAVKLLSHDPAWRSLDALRYHYWTQPLPTPLAWYANQLPGWFQHLSTATVFAIELACPFLIFLPRRVRFLGAAGFVMLQSAIFLTGNYTFFNILTVSLCLFLLDDQFLSRFTIRSGRVLHTSRQVTVPLFIILGCLGLLQLANTMSNSLPSLAPGLLRFISPFGVVNSYGLFAVMTTTRPEIIVQGSNDGTNWSDYEFRFKPGDPRLPPRWVAPYQPRLDWQMWFAALSNWRSNPWFASFMVRLLEGSPPVLKLLKTDPFPAHPPRLVRAVLYEYQFTNWQERRESGRWWNREEKGIYFPAVSLKAVQPGSAP